MDIYDVSFSPARKHVEQIKEWLIEEWSNTGVGFYCNWDSINDLFTKKQAAVISDKNNTAIGFAAWTTNNGQLLACIAFAEIKPGYRQKGIGKQLISELLTFLRDKNIMAVSLECAPKTSAVFWKEVGFLEFPDRTYSYDFNAGSKTKLFIVLVPALGTSLTLDSEETIEMWNDDRYLTPSPAYIWNMEFKPGTRELLKPIIHPAHYEWKLRWCIKGEMIKDDLIKRFRPEIDFGQFIIITHLPI